VRERDTTHLDLLEGLALVPAAVPLALHALESDEALACPFLADAGAALHGGEGGAGREERVPVAEPDGAKGAIADVLEVRPGALGAWRALA
jgi:hypothetical protein